MALSLLQIRDGAKDRADLAGTGKPSDTRWNAFINYAIERLWRLLVRQDPDIAHATFDFTLTGTNSSTALPATFRKLRGVSRDPDNPTLRVDLRKWNFKEREDISRGVSSVAGTYRLFYVAGPTKLTLDADNIDSVLEPYGEAVELMAAIKGLNQEETDGGELRLSLKEELDEIVDDIGGRDSGEGDTIADIDDGSGGWPLLMAAAAPSSSSLRVPYYRILGANLVIR